MRTVLVVLLVATAGCLGATEEALPPADVAAALPALPASYAYDCPPGGEARGDLCVRSLASRTESLQEPYLAADPNRPGVYAVGVNAGVTRVSADPAAPGLQEILLDVYFTEDGGETWRLSRLPRVETDLTPSPVEWYGSGDPALAFDEHGVLHVSGIVSPMLPLVGWEVFYTSTPDLGKTWTTPVAFGGDDDNDRNWITVAPGGRVYVPWQNVGDSSELAWSLDGGQTWRTQERTEVEEDCITVSPVQMLDGVPLLACAGLDPDEGELTGVRILAFDDAAGTLQPLANVPGEAVWPHLRALPDGTLVLVFEDWEARTVRYALGTDGGRNWTEPVDVRDAVTLTGAWRNAAMYWTDVDPWGGLHLVLGGSSETAPRVTQRHVAHAVLDPLGGGLLAEKSLLPPSVPPRPPQTLGRGYGDHYYGMAFAGAEAMLVWTEERTLQFTRVLPILPDLPDPAGA